LAKLRADGATLQVAYEAGPTGFVLYRHLQKMGIDCLIVAPSKMPVPGGKRQKTDRRDAELLARLLRAGELTAIAVAGGGRKQPKPAGTKPPAASAWPPPCAHCGATHVRCVALVHPDGRRVTLRPLRDARDGEPP